MAFKSNLKMMEVNVKNAFEELEKFEIETPTRIFKLTPTNKCNGWLAIYIDIPSLDKQNSLLKTEAATLATEPLNNIKESDLAS
jgi:hypothetical protein